MADPARLTLADQALIHTMAFLAIEIIHDATWATFRAEIEDILPQVNRGIPVIERLAQLADRVVRPQSDGDVMSALDQAGREIAMYHKVKAARAIDSLKSESAACSPAR